MAASSSSEGPSVLFVCLGNICRSPMAEGVFRHVLSSAPAGSVPSFSRVDSAGTMGYHTGSSPDPRTMAVLKDNGITGYKHSARTVKQQDFETFDYIFGMDSDNYEDLLDMRKRLAQKKKGDTGLADVRLWGSFGGKSEGEEVVDPYYGAHNGFEVAFEQMQRFSNGFLKWLGESGSKLS